MRIHACLILLILMGAFGGVAAAQTTSTSTSSTSFSQVVITQTTVSPGVFMTGDTGTISITIQNNGADEVDIARATLFTDGVTLLNPDAYDQVIALGPDNSRTFTFNVQATGAPGLYEPQFYADFQGAGSMTSYVPLQIDNTNLQVAVANIPSYFGTNRENQITLQVSNPRDDNLSSITITPSGDGVRSLQNTYFVGDLGPGQSTQAVFSVIPSQETNLTFTTTYRNGINSHSTNLVIPILIDNSRVSADLVVNDITLTPKGGSYEIDGDVTNGGVDQALAVVVTVDSPAQPVDPYPSYVIGTLAVDDFSSFSVTFSGQALSTVPLLVQWKDSDGNSYQNTVEVNLRTATISGSTAGTVTRVAGGGGGGPFGFFGGGRGGLEIPIIPIVIIVVIAVVLVYAWRKGYLDRILKRGKGKQGNQGNQQQVRR